ncbi:MAG: hypothetical protein JO010_02050 [Alphaproteobacteria bacterium]|nr:hypothetical protein [Alphaproteobacteria bacterium]
MDHEQKIWKLARILIGKHSGGACDIALQRAREALDGHDYAAARVWVEAAETVTKIMATRTRPRPKEPAPSLKNVLDGGVTTAVMEADGVDRTELESMLDKAAKKCRD